MTMENLPRLDGVIWQDDARGFCVVRYEPRGDVLPWAWDEAVGEWTDPWGKDREIMQAYAEARATALREAPDYVTRQIATMTARVRGQFLKLARRAYRTHRREDKAERRMCRLIRRGL